jgi:hypothetical protein
LQSDKGKNGFPIEQIFADRLEIENFLENYER